MTVDLHLHTTFSDGNLTPTEVVERAEAIGLETIAITDHDTVEGISEAQLAAQNKDLKVLTGIELNTELEGSQIHMLGYCFDLQAQRLTNTLNRLRTARYDRIKQMVDKLALIEGIEIDFERVCQIAGSSNLSRVHLARAIIEAGYATKVSEAFDKYIDQDSPAYVSRFKLTPQDAIKLIKSVGGVAILAHPGPLDRDDLIPDLIAAGLDGIEVYHSEHDKVATRHYEKLALEYDLIKTGGSDCHGDYEDQLLLGTVEVPKKVVSTLQQIC
ncbi:MAG: PHP domain-containing protein [Bacillota bacterium]